MSDSTSQLGTFGSFTDADLRLALRRALRTCVVIGVVCAVAFAVAAGWRASLLCLAGTLVSAVGLYEWQQLIEFVNARLDKQKAPRSTVRVVIMFGLRLIFAAVIIYVSLKYSIGVPYPLIAGLGLAVVALTMEAVRLLRS